MQFGKRTSRELAPEPAPSDDGQLQRVLPFRKREVTQRELEELQASVSLGVVYEMGIDSFFGASHAMRPTGELHTHSFRVQALLVSERLDDQGMLYGFREVSDLLEAEAKKYANLILNEIEPFNVIQPTGENLAAVILKDLRTTLRHDLPGSPRLVGVTLWENPTSYVRVTPLREVQS